MGLKDETWNLKELPFNRLHVKLKPVTFIKACTDSMIWSSHNLYSPIQMFLLTNKKFSP